MRLFRILLVMALVQPAAATRARAPQARSDRFTAAAIVPPVDSAWMLLFPGGGVLRPAFAAAHDARPDGVFASQPLYEASSGEPEPSSSEGALLTAYRRYEKIKVGDYVVGERTRNTFRVSRIIERAVLPPILVARDPATGETVSMHVLQRDQDFALRRVTWEVTALLAVQQARFEGAPVFVDYAVSENHAFGLVITQRMHLTTLEQMKKTLSVLQLSRFTRALLRRLGDLHAIWIVHRDIRSGTVGLSNRTKEIQLASFGNAVVRGSAVGNPGLLPFAYAAPERGTELDDQPAYDIYQTAFMLLSLVSGMPSKDLRRHVAWLDGDELERAIAPLVPEPWHPATGVLARALAPNPRDRFESAAAFEQALLEVEDRLPRDDSSATPSPNTLLVVLAAGLSLAASLSGSLPGAFGRAAGHRILPARTAQVHPHPRLTSAA